MWGEKGWDQAENAALLPAFSSPMFPPPLHPTTSIPHLSRVIAQGFQDGEQTIYEIFPALFRRMCAGAREAGGLERIIIYRGSLVRPHGENHRESPNCFERACTLHQRELLSHIYLSHILPFAP